MRVSQDKLAFNIKVGISVSVDDGELAWLED